MLDINWVWTGERWRWRFVAFLPPFDCTTLFPTRGKSAVTFPGPRYSWLFHTGSERESVCVWKCVWFSRFLFAVFNFKRKERQREREKTVPPQVIYLDQISLIDPAQSMADKHFVPRLKSLTTVQEISHVLDLRQDGITRTEEMWWCVCVCVHFSLGHLFWLKRK